MHVILDSRNKGFFMFNSGQQQADNYDDDDDDLILLFLFSDERACGGAEIKDGGWQGDACYCIGDVSWI